MTDPAGDAGAKDGGSVSAGGPIGRSGRRRAKIRHVANLGAALVDKGSAEARAKEPEHARADPAAPAPSIPDGVQEPGDWQYPETGGGGGPAPAATPDDAAAAGVAAALDVADSVGSGSGPAPVHADRAGAVTGRGEAVPEDAPPEVADLDEMPDNRLDLAEFVIQAAVSGDDDGAIQIPWVPEPPAGTGFGDAAARTERPRGAAGRPDSAGRTEDLRQRGPDAGRDGRVAVDGPGAIRAGNPLAAGRGIGNRRAAPASASVRMAGDTADFRNTGPDLRIPIIEEDDIPPVRATYEEERGAPAAADDRTGPGTDAALPAGPLPSARDGTRPTGETANPAARSVRPRDAAPVIPKSAKRAQIGPARSAFGKAGPAPTRSDIPAGRPSGPGAAARARAQPPERTETDRPAHRKPPEAAKISKRKARTTGIAGGADRVRTDGLWNRLAARPGGFDDDRRTNFLCGMAIVAALGAVAWYFSGLGMTKPTQTVEAGKAGPTQTSGGGKAATDGAKKSTVAARPDKAPIYQPAMKIEPATLSSLGNVEYRITPGTVDRVVTSAGGDTFGALLLRAGVGVEDSVLAVNALRKVYNPRSLPIGLELKVIFEAPGIGRPRFLGYRFDSSTDRMVQVARLATGGYTAKKVEKIVTQVFSRVDGQIETSLFGAGVKAGVPPRIMLQMVRLFSFSVDFQRDLHGGEKFHIMYRSQKDESGRIVRHGDIVYSSLHVGGRTQKLYLYEQPNGGTQYLNERGQGNRRVLMKTPIDGARLTSRFGYRKHPLLGFTKLHAGVDFGARPGTPILAAGSGTIVKIGWFGAFGRYIRIRHGSVYETAYAHMSRFRRGLRVGSRVKQGETIGYVGRSGRSTGPHLHYEVLRNGRQVNPMKIALPSRKNLKGRELKRFLAHRNEVDARYAALGKVNERQRQGSVQTVRSDGGAGCKNGVRTDPKDTRPCN
ncbi:MAG: peptidoglycan DD-metalloendopeptidase family protein [Rhodospirillaceae bacterium]|nr:peptidoglycan DD-metalloendopeptidase family protein [Rhodospirillaceae bacterium]